MNIACPHCRHTLVNDGTLAGKVVACTVCGGRFEMPIPKALPAGEAVDGERTPPPDAFDFLKTRSASASAYRYYGPEKNPGGAAVASFFVPGLGQIFNGELGKGFVFLLIALGLFIATCVTGGLGLPVLIVWDIFTVFEAYSAADAENRKRSRTRR